MIDRNPNISKLQGLYKRKSDPPVYEVSVVQAVKVVYFVMVDQV